MKYSCVWETFSNVGVVFDFHKRSVFPVWPNNENVLSTTDSSVWSAAADRTEPTRRYSRSYDIQVEQISGEKSLENGGEISLKASAEEYT